MTQSTPAAEVKTTGRGGRSAAHASIVSLFSALEVRGNALNFIEDGSAISHTVSEDEVIIMPSTDSNGGTVTLPGSPTDGRVVIISDVDDSSGTNSITVGRNGNNIDGSASDFTINTNGDTELFVWDDDNTTWRSIEL